MTSWVLPISKDFEHHWDIAKSHLLWDMRTSRPIRSGDVVYFWRSGVGGFVGRAVISADARPLAEGEPVPWTDEGAYATRIEFSSAVDGPTIDLRWADVMQATGFRQNPSLAYHSAEGPVERALASLFGAPAVADEVPGEDAAVLQLTELGIDRRERTLAAIALRRGQSGFRSRLLSAYDGRCAVTETSAPEVLEAAHIAPYRGDHTNVGSNGLLLRSDVHTLFDLHLLTAVPTQGAVVVRVAPSVRSSVYAEFDRAPLRVPRGLADRPSPELLRDHNAGCEWLLG